MRPAKGDHSTTVDDLELAERALDAVI